MENNEELVSIEMNLTPTAIRTLKSYLALSGKTSTEVSEEIGTVVSDLLIERLKKKIAGELGIEVAQAPSPVNFSRARAVPNQIGHHAANFTDTTGISDGLGDEDLETDHIEGLTDPTALVPRTGGLTYEAIEKDMQVENPDVEAASEPNQTWAEQMAHGTSSDDIFAAAAGINTNDNRLQKRKKRSIGKGKVTTLTEGGLNASEASRE